jgi:hypothetical protein
MFHLPDPEVKRVNVPDGPRLNDRNVPLVRTGGPADSAPVLLECGLSKSQMQVCLHLVVSGIKAEYDSCNSALV